MRLRSLFCGKCRTASFSEERAEAKGRRGEKRSWKRRGAAKRNADEEARTAYMELVAMKRGMERELGGIRVQQGKVVRKKRDLELLLQKVFGNSKKGKCHQAIAGHYSQKLERLDSRARLLSRSIGQAVELQDLLSKGIINKCHADVIVGSMVTQLASNTPGPPSREHRTISGAGAKEVVSGTSDKTESSKSSERRVKVEVVAGPPVAANVAEEEEAEGKVQEGPSKKTCEDDAALQEEARMQLAAAYAAKIKARMEEGKEEVELKEEGREVEEAELAACPSV